MPSLLTFSEAIDDSSQFSKRHLLLGNGFSIACCPDIFHYGSLFQEADFSGNPNLTAVFDALRTQDFEIAIRNLETGAALLPVYVENGASIAAQMREDALALKEILLSTIAHNHPNLPLNISISKFRACRSFLRSFLGSENDGQVFTLNYDLLLYWTLMHEDASFGTPIELAVNDGFGNHETDPDADYVVWQGDSGAHQTKIHFLHGGLHLFDAGNELQKYTWIRTNHTLIDQARHAIHENKFPLFVAEGQSTQKKARIRHNAYLYQGFKQLSANAENSRCCFFIYGHSLAENDNHILHKLGKGHFKKLYVSLYGDQNSTENAEIIGRAQQLAGLRNSRHPLELAFYDAQSANVWGN